MLFEAEILDLVGKTEVHRWLTKREPRLACGALEAGVSDTRLLWAMVGHGARAGRSETGWLIARFGAGAAAGATVRCTHA